MPNGLAAVVREAVAAIDKSQLELQWYSGYNDCMEVTLGFSVRSAETDEWSGVSPADGKMQRVLRALDWQ